MKRKFHAKHHAKWRASAKVITKGPPVKPEDDIKKILGEFMVEKKGKSVTVVVNKPFVFGDEDTKPGEFIDLPSSLAAELLNCGKVRLPEEGEKDTTEVIISTYPLDTFGPSTGSGTKDYSETNGAPVLGERLGAEE